jgi:D-alanine--poly(phosphoribitol) ligase subunit 1
VFIRDLIQKRLQSDFSIFNKEGQQVPTELVKKEYQIIRQYMLDHYSANREFVAIKQTKDYRYLLTILACLETGVPFVPMKQDFPEDRVQQILEDANSKVVIDDEAMALILKYQETKVQDLPSLTSEQIAYILFTSGSTGRPKGVVIKRRGLELYWEWMNNYFTNINHTDRLLQVTDFTFDICMIDIALFLKQNVVLHFSDFKGNLFKLGAEIEAYRITTLNTVPNNLNIFLSDLIADRMDYTCLKHMFMGGARFTLGLYEKFRKYFPVPINVYNLYGPTETTVYSHVKKISFNEAEDIREGNVSIGTCVPYTTCLIYKDGKKLGPLEVGEILLGGENLMKEYSNSPEQTASAITHIDGMRFYRTGDLAYVDEKGQYYVVGRMDDTIKHRGFRINLLDIDSYITRLPYVQDSVTVAIPHEETENQTIGYVILKEEKSLKDFKKDLSQLLLDYQIPEKIFFVDKYPTNNNGKVCKKTLKAQYLESINKA